jgi:hypothetical protein
MNATIELRLPEAKANTVLLAEEGERIAGIARRVIYPLDDERLGKIGRLHREMKARGESLITSWSIRREYSPSEIERAEMLHLIIAPTLEPAGEECGTVYDESVACELCGAGRTLHPPLRLDTRKFGSDISVARTIAGDEVICSEQIAKVIGRLGRETINLTPVETTSTEIRSWSALSPNKRGASAQVLATTQFGIDPFDFDDDGIYRCPRGHVAGLNLLSELWIARTSVSGADITFSDVFVGTKRGLLRPYHLIMISSPLWKEIRAEGASGCSVEVVHLA